MYLGSGVCVVYVVCGVDVVCCGTGFVLYKGWDQCVSIWCNESYIDFIQS
jgi:hypothetical protein